MKDRPTGNDEVLAKLIARASEIGATELEVEYEDRTEIVYAFRGATGISIAAFPSGEPEAKALLTTLDELSRRKKKGVVINGVECKLKVRVHNSFGEPAFRIRIVGD